MTYLTEANFGEGGVVGPEPLYEEDDAGHGLGQPVTSQSCIYIKANKANASAAKPKPSRVGPNTFTILKMCCQSDPQDGQRGATRETIKGEFLCKI